MDENEKLLTIGQFAALHGINKKTLMWYDETGLFQPAVVNPDNGYRCYTYRQSPLLETILLLRELDVSVNDIRTFMQNRSAKNMKSLLEERIAQLDNNIMHLQAVRKTVFDYHQNMVTLLTIDLSEISLIEKEERCLVTVDIDKDTSFEKEVELITAETTKYRLGRLHNASYGSMLPVTSLQNGNFDDYTGLFIEIPFLTQSKELAEQFPDTPKNGLHIQPKGNYLRAFHKGDLNRLPQRYQEILDYAKRQKITLHGYSYEKGINEAVAMHIDDYIVRIEIPILG